MTRSFSLVLGAASLALLLVTLVTSCAGPEPATRIDPDNDVEEQTDVVVLDDDLESDLEVTSRSRRLTDNRLEIKVKIVNRSGDDLHVQIQTSFKDDDGFQTEEPTPFAHRLITENSTMEYSETSIGKDATRYIVRIKEGES